MSNNPNHQSDNGGLSALLPTTPYDTTVTTPIDAVAQRLETLHEEPSEISPGYGTLVTVETLDEATLDVEVSLVRGLEPPRLPVAIFRGRFSGAGDHTQKTGTIYYGIGFPLLILLIAVGIAAIIILTGDPATRPQRFIFLSLIILTSMVAGVVSYRGSHNHLRQILDEIK